MSEITRRVTDAILTVLFPPPEIPPEKFGYVVIPPQIYDQAQRSAIAAIKAMRQVPDVCYDGYRCDKLWRDLDSKEVWNLWIDAALADDKATKAA
jgi:hypothetical protein